MKRNGKWEVRNGNYEFNLVCFFPLQILFDAVAIVLPFRQGGVVAPLSAGRRPTVMKVIAFQAKAGR